MDLLILLYLEWIPWLWVNRLHGDHSICVGEPIRRILLVFSLYRQAPTVEGSTALKRSQLPVLKASVVTESRGPMRKDHYLLCLLFSKFLIRLSARRMLFPLVPKQWAFIEAGHQRRASANINKLKVPLGQKKNDQDCWSCFFFLLLLSSFSRESLFIACVLICAHLKCLSGGRE